MALAGYCEDGDLEIDIDNSATEGSIRGVAVGRNVWIFFGSNRSGNTAAVLRRLPHRVSASASIRSRG
jgi:hypothetical protein